MHRIRPLTGSDSACPGVKTEESHACGQSLRISPITRPKMRNPGVPFSTMIGE
jgi:hypothetical protein